MFPFSLPVTKRTKLQRTVNLGGPAVLVTNAFGFVSQHIILLLLLRGRRVIGTVTHPQDGVDLMYAFHHPRFAVVVVEDLQEKRGKYDIVFQSYRDITQVIHVSDTYSDPGKDCNVGVLESIAKYGQRVQRVLITSSFHAVANYDRFGDPFFIHNEDTWNTVRLKDVRNTPLGPHRDKLAYASTKVEEELHAWRFMNDHRGSIQFSLVVVVAPVVLGPQCLPSLSATQDGNSPLNHSSRIIRRLADSRLLNLNSFSACPWPTVDVRDLAVVYIEAVMNPHMREKRLLAFGDGFYSDFLAMSVIYREYELFRDTLGLDALDTDVSNLEYTCYRNNPFPNIDNSRTRDALGPEFRFKTFSEQVKASMDSWVKNDWGQLVRHARFSADISDM